MANQFELGAELLKVLSGSVQYMENGYINLRIESKTGDRAIITIDSKDKSIIRIKQF